MPSYPSLPTIRPEGLVPPDAQPTYLPLEGFTTPDELNLCAEIIDRHVEKGWGDRPAIFFSDEKRTLSFADVQARTQELAGVLRSLGLEVGDRVGVRFPNRPEGIIAMLAAWRAGAAVVPVPPQARAAELPAYVADVEARFLIVHESEENLTEVAKAGEALGVEHVIAGPLGHDTPFLSWAELVERTEPLVDPVAVPADMPSVFWHTGGTTGKPKCCYHTARQYVTAGKAAGLAFDLDPDTDVHLAFPGPIGHAAGMIGRTNVSLLNGVPYVEVESMADAGALLRAVSDYGVTWVMAIAATWANMLKLYRKDPDAYDLSRLSKAYGPMMSVVAEEIYDGWVELGHPVQNLMGSTQFGTWFLVPPPHGKAPAGCVGVPSPGYEAKIIDAEAPGFNEIPHGEIGLLCLRGPSGLTYWNRPEMQEKDVREGWTVMDDLAKMDDDGAVWYLGRSDFMISSSGFKVAPVEVEEAAGRHRAVAEVSVVGSPDPERGEAVTAFIVLQEGAVASDELAKDIQDFIKQEISPYKYPRRIVFVPSLPRDLVGKVQVRDLRDRARAIAYPTDRRYLELAL
jgi:2-aminobenzoate-CoA ligase